MPASNPPPGSFSSMPNGPFLWLPHKTHILTGEPGAMSSHLRSAAGTMISCLPFAELIYLVSSSIDWANGSAFNGRPGAEPRWNHEDRSARPVRCSAWLSRGRLPDRIQVVDHPLQLC